MRREGGPAGLSISVANQDGLRDISFAEVVKAATGKRVTPVDPKKNAAQLCELGIAFDAVLAELNKPTTPCAVPPA